MYYVVNVDTQRPYRMNQNYRASMYSTERTAKAQCTRLNKQYSTSNPTTDAIQPVQWSVVSVKEYCDRPVKMVERVNIMTGEKFMEADNTPYFCSPSSETYWSS